MLSKLSLISFNRILSEARVLVTDLSRGFELRAPGPLEHGVDTVPHHDSDSLGRGPAERDHVSFSRVRRAYDDIAAAKLPEAVDDFGNILSIVRVGVSNRNFSDHIIGRVD